jgi:hypothetical protein
MFAITVDGRKLPPYLIFKRKKMPNAKLANGVHVFMCVCTRQRLDGCNYGV